MKFEMPKANRTRLEQLLEYLGDRADDFKKCFDVESEWCWKYADLMLRGLEERNLKYAEGHHVVPASFYGKRHCSKVDDDNLTFLTYGEHLWAHYCLVWCATGKLQGKMARAFITMYNVWLSGSRPIMPSEAELLDVIPELELIRIRAMEPQWAKVEAEGRSHYYEDPKQYYKDWREANREKIAESKKAYHEANREKIAKRAKAYREANKEKISEHKKAYRESNKEKILERDKAYRESNKEKISSKKKVHYESNRDKILEQKKAYHEANRDKIVEKGKVYYEANREKIAKRMKAYREANREKIAEHKKAHYEANKEKINEQKKAHYETMKAAGYRLRKNALTGKRTWIFVGLPEQEEAA